MSAALLQNVVARVGSGHRVAMLSPHRLLGLPLFWVTQPLFVLTLAGTIAAFFVLAPYTYAPADGWEWLVVAVQLIAVWGAVITARGLAVLQVEKAIVDEIESRGMGFLRELHAGQWARIELDNLEQTVLPGNRTKPLPAMIRLFQHIIREARDRKFESSVSVMEPYREESLDDIFRLQNLQKLALWLGILGTFIGLLLAMQSADMSKLLDERNFIALVQKMFAGMIVSFSASLAGLQVAVVLGVFLLLLRHRQKPYFQAMETAVVTMLSLARNALNKDMFIAELGQVATTVTALTNRVQQQARELRKTQERIDEQTERIGAGITSLSGAGATFEGFLQRIADAQNQFIADIRSVYDTISLERLGETVRTSVGGAAGIMSDQLTVATKQIENRLKDFNSAVSELSEALLLQSTEASETAKKLRDQIATSTAESTAAVRTVSRQMQEVLARDAHSAGSVRAEMTDLARRIAELSRAIDRIDSLPPRPTRSIWNFLTSLRW